MFQTLQCIFPKYNNTLLNNYSIPIKIKKTLLHYYHLMQDPIQSSPVVPIMFWIGRTKIKQPIQSFWSKNIVCILLLLRIIRIQYFCSFWCKSAYSPGAYKGCSYSVKSAIIPPPPHHKSINQTLNYILIKFFLLCSGLYFHIY